MTAIQYDFVGVVNFITEDKEKAIVTEVTLAEALAETVDYEFAHKLINADFSDTSVNSLIAYKYNADSDNNNGRDVTLFDLQA